MQPSVPGATLAPVRRTDGYLPIEDYGLIGDGRVAALVGRDGALDWLCVPRFDAPPVFAGLLDAARGGTFAVTVDGLVAAGQRYVEDTGVLQTTLRGPDGTAVVTDLLTLRSGADLSEIAPSGRGELLRIVEVPAGSVRLRVVARPYRAAEWQRHGGGLRLRCPHRKDVDLHLSASALDGAETALNLDAGTRLHLLLRWDGAGWRSALAEPDALLSRTVQAWRRWSRGIAYDGPKRALVRRSTVTLKLLDHSETGAIVAAPTSSLPEEIGGVRNWDYRYAWVRDTAFSVYALRRVGLGQEADAFLAWVLDAVERDGRST